MSDRTTAGGTSGDGRPVRDHTPDRELDVRAVILTGLALAVATALAALASWWLSIGLRDRLEAQDPEPPVLIETMMPYQPPSPNLQTDPASELAEARSEEETILGTYEWNDEARTSARVPIERAMELLLETRPGAEAFGDGEGAAAPDAGGTTEPEESDAG